MTWKLCTVILLPSSTKKYWIQKSSPLIKREFFNLSKKKALIWYLKTLWKHKFHKMKYHQRNLIFKSQWILMRIWRTIKLMTIWTMKLSQLLQRRAQGIKSKWAKTKRTKKLKSFNSKLNHHNPLLKSS